MKEQLMHLEFEIELQPGEKLTLPSTVIDGVGAGRWLISIQPATLNAAPFRSHEAFLNGYATVDEGLYDDDASR